MTTQVLHVRINSPEALIFESEAQWVSSCNVEGPFDVLPMHANFITLIENKKIMVKTVTGIKEFLYQKAVLYAHNNFVSIYINL